CARSGNSLFDYW
nr:immunoglobulin heavy chain junction region [Macaca mulatta]MOY26058.1 immunoglobulin heavy chain junction region [Macaca mulatta]MOY27320.1 immunoglobulin heavy chain junction region [Macaca mulatta]MOY27405.1 immunoglobulin heavy chain junction region [Macaca mulatta]MOY29682.1 immunoglobulin heavy chain junction region [Macaca mulatta]